MSRDELILNRLYHPCTTEELLDLLPTYQTARRKLQRLVKQKKCRKVGTVQFGKGRPTDVFCARTVKEDNLKHEVLLTKLLLPLLQEDQT